MKGIPTCTSGQLEATTTTVAQVAFAEQRPIDVSSKLLLFNGGESGAKTMWCAHVYFSSPVSGVIVTR